MFRHVVVVPINWLHKVDEVCKQASSLFHLNVEIKVFWVQFVPSKDVIEACVQMTVVKWLILTLLAVLTLTALLIPTLLPNLGMLFVLNWVDRRFIALLVF